MSDVVFPDALEDLKAWLASDPTLAPLHGGRVYFRLPNEPTYPCLRLYRAGGGKQPGQAPEMDLRLAVEVWGGRFEDYPAVRQLATALESVASEVENEVVGTSTLLQYALATSAFDQPDPETGWPRIVVDLLVTLRSI